MYMYIELNIYLKAALGKKVLEWLTLLRFDKGFNNLRERTSRFKHFYFARGAQIST